MSTDLAVRTPPVPLGAPTSHELEEIKETVRNIASTEFVPKNLRGNPHGVLAAILFGREIGLGPMQSLSEVHMIDGRPSLSAKAKLKRAREAGHSITGQVTAEIATVTGKRADTGDAMTVTFTLEDAKRAGLLGKQNWKSWPDDMLWARAVARLCRRLFDDVPGALFLDPDEAELTDEQRVDEATADLPLPGPAESPADEPEARGDEPSDAPPPAEVVEGHVVEEDAEDGQTAFPIPAAARHREEN